MKKTIRALCVAAFAATLLFTPAVSKALAEDANEISKPADEQGSVSEGGTERGDSMDKDSSKQDEMMQKEKEDHDMQDKDMRDMKDIKGGSGY